MRLLDVELEAAEAASLARFALVALHDPQSTRKLNGMNFKKLVMDAEVASGDAQLAVVALPDPTAATGFHAPPRPAATRQLPRPACAPSRSSCSRTAAACRA